jgi:PAS domain S-box-containing protein
METMIFKTLFENSSIGIIISNEDGIIEKSNLYADKIFGFDTEELIGKTVEILVPEKLREGHVNYREKYIKNPQIRPMGNSLNLSAVKKNGEHFPVNISLSFFKEKDRKLIVSFISDITERRQAENDLLKLTEELESKISERTKELSDALLELSLTNKGLYNEMEQRKKVEAQIREMLEREKELGEMKSRFVSMASHEFRTPLGGILTSANLIEKYSATEDQPKREKHIKSIKKSVENLTSILNDFLSLDKLEHGKINFSPSVFNFTTFLEELVQDIQETNLKHRFDIENNAKSIVVFQEKEMLRNVLLNLLSNAIKYSPENSAISLRTSVKEDCLICEIQDQGIGIPLEDQKYLFERFFRAHNATNLQGTGLGLNIVKSYLDLMGGQIDFVSTENVGTIFTVRLPLEKK